MKKKKEEEEYKKAFYNHKTNGVHLVFKNGNSISTIWGSGSYTNGYPYKESTYPEEKFGSNEVEIMFDCSEKLKKKIEKKYHDSDSQPIGYLDIEKWLEIINLLSKEK